MTGTTSRLWTVDEVIQKIRLGPDNRTEGDQLADRAHQLVEWAATRGVSVQDAKRSTSGNIRFYLGGCDLFYICARAPKSKDLREEAIWILNTGRPHQRVTGLVTSAAFATQDDRLQVMRRLRDEIDGTDACPGFHEDLSVVNPYLWLRLLVPETAYSTFLAIYDDVVDRMS